MLQTTNQLLLNIVISSKNPNIEQVISQFRGPEPVDNYLITTLQINGCFTLVL